MSVLVDGNTRVVVQGITGREGGFHALRCAEYGTSIVAGVTPGRGGILFDGRVPVFDSVEEAVRETGANVSLVFVPASATLDAVLEAASAGIALIVCITEGVPAMDMVKAHRFLEGRPVRLLGPNCPGVISPVARCKVGIIPGEFHLPGGVGVVSRSGTLTYEVVKQLTDLGIGQSTCVGIGGDLLPGTTFVDVLRLFQDDPDTDMVVLIGEIGGTMEQEAAEYIEKEFTKPVVATVVGISAPPGKRMGHAGAIVTGAAARADEKMKALARAGAVIAPSPAEIGTIAQKVLGS